MEITGKEFLSELKARLEVNHPKLIFMLAGQEYRNRVKDMLNDVLEDMSTSKS